MAAVYEEKERIRQITTANRKLIERLVDSKPGVDNSRPHKAPSYHVMISEKKAKRVDSLNLVSRLNEHERIVNQNAKNKLQLQSVKPMIDVRKQLKDFKKSKKM